MGHVRRQLHTPGRTVICLVPDDGATDAPQRVVLIAIVVVAASACSAWPRVPVARIVPGIAVAETAADIAIAVIVAGISVSVVVTDIVVAVIVSGISVAVEVADIAIAVPVAGTGNGLRGDGGYAGQGADDGDNSERLLD